MSVPTKYQEQLKSAHAERDAILERLGESFGRMQFDNPPSMSPFTADGTDYSDETTPVCVVSLKGLRRIESIVSELEQRREA